MEKIKKFYEALQADKAMQERANPLNEQYKGTDPAAIDEKAAIKAIVEFAKGEGYDFTATELEEYQKGMRALGDEELDAVAGGLFDGSSGGCSLIGLFDGDGCDCSLSGWGRNPKKSDGTCACILVGGVDDKAGSHLACIEIGTIVAW